jgi:tetratricopeptide (TPR) repeat protein
MNRWARLILVISGVVFVKAFASKPAGEKMAKRPAVDLSAMQEAIGSGKTMFPAPAAASYAHYLKARLHHHAAEHQAAIDELRLALATDDSNAVMLTQLAEQFARAADFLKAESQLKRALDSAPNYAPAHLLLGRILLEERKHTRAKAELQKAINLSPTDPEGYLMLTQAYLEEGLIDEAVNCVEKLDEAAHGEPAGMRRLGLALAGAGDYNRARKLLTKSVERDSGDVDSWLALGKIFEAQNAIDEALGAFEKALERDTDNVQALLGAGRLALQLNKKAIADGFFDAALSLGKDDQLVVSISILYLASNQVRRAESLLEATEKTSEDARLHFYSAMVHERARHYKKALESFQKVPTTATELTSSVILHEAFCRSQLGQHAKAQQLLGQIQSGADRAIPADFTAVSGRIAEQAGEFKKAEALFHEYYSSDRTSASIGALTQFYQRRKRLSEAAVFFQTELKKFGDNDDIRFGLAVVFDKLGDRKRASEVLEPMVKADRPRAMNFAAYLLAQQNLDLEAAESLSRRVNAQKPHVPAYLDTLGFILLKQQKLADAKQLFEEASSGEDDPTLLEHLSLVHEALGEVTLALEMTRDAIALIKEDFELAESADQLNRLELRLKVLSKGKATK